MSMADFSAWIGRSEERADSIDSARCIALQAALGRATDLAPGAPMPVLDHWLHFWDVRPPEETGVDGHPLKGRFLPPIELPRRMWAGGRLRFLAPLAIGEAVRKRTTIRSVERKSGRSGDLMVVTLLHEISGSGGLAIEEEQDLVYRAPGPPLPMPAPPEHPLQPGRASLLPDPVLLFRYSALTMNSHRIHYDAPYAAQEEGYAGLVVHGPLQATLLARLAEQLLGRPLSAFTFRGVAPAFAGERIELHAEAEADRLSLRVEQLGRTTMTATAE